MLDTIVSHFNFVNGPLVVLLLSFEVVFWMLKELDEDGHDILPDGTYPIERGILS